MRSADETDRLLECYRIVEEELEIRYRGEYTRSDILRLAQMTVKAQFLSHYFSYVPSWRLMLRSLCGERVLPDFACVGALKSGTSELATYLLQHPNILVPLSKEPNRDNAEKWRVFYPTVREKAEAEAQIGKTLTGYFEPKMHEITVLDSFHAARPDAKAIIILRDPVRRAYSHFKWDVLMAGKKSTMSQYTQTYGDYLRQALDVFPALGTPTAITKMPLLHAGVYAPSVRLWLAKFGQDSIHFVSAEDFFSDIPGTVRKIYRFLELPDHTPEIRPVINRNAITAPPEDAGSRALLSEFYRPWNAQLYELIGRDLHWL